MTAGDRLRAEAVIDLNAIRANLQAQRIAGVAQMAVVKADAYGHGAVPVARAARDAGAEWLGLALPEEALELRDAGDTGPLLAWLLVPEQPAIAECVRRDVDLGVSALWALEAIADVARTDGRRARVHLKADTGLGRGGVAHGDWPDVIRRAVQLRDHVDVVGIWSHLACADEPSHVATDQQVESFTEALDLAAAAGIEPQVRHLASSGAALSRPDTHYDMVRLGVSTYGLSPGREVGPPYPHGVQLTPAMTLRARVSLSKRVAAGHGVSYGLTWRAPEATTLALVPLGYGDGIPRVVTEPWVWLGGQRRPVVGRVAMDQIVVDAGDLDVAAGDDVVVFGGGATGVPSADEWADWSGTIGYEIVTRIGPRVPRTYVGT